MTGDEKRCIDAKARRVMGTSCISYVAGSWKQCKNSVGNFFCIKMIALMGYECVIFGVDVKNVSAEGTGMFWRFYRFLGSF